RRLLELAGKLHHRGYVREHGAPHAAHLRVELPGQQPREVAVERAHRRRDRHLVVVEDDEQVDVRRDAGVVQRLEGHARAHRAVADDGHMAPAPGPDVLARVARGDGHAERSRDRGGRMRRAEGVVRRLVTFGKAADATELAQRGHALAPAGEDLVGIALVTDIPYQPVARRMKDVVERDRELDRAEVGRQVAAGTGDRLDDEATQLVGELRKAITAQLAQVPRIVDGLEQWIRRHPGLLQDFRSTTRPASCARRIARAPKCASARWASSRSPPASDRASCRPISETYVGLSASLSLPAVLPRVALSPSTSSTSSMTWKASPIALA